MCRYGVVRHECRSGQLRRSLLWSFAAALGALAILASVATQAAPAEVESDVSWQPTDTSGGEANDTTMHVPTAHVDEPHASVSGGALTPAGDLPQQDDDAVPRSPESRLDRQGLYKQAAGHAGELKTDTVSTGGDVESDTGAASTPPSSPPSEASAEESGVLERDWHELPPQHDALRQSVAQGAQYSDQGDRQHEQQQVTVTSVTASPHKRADDTDVTRAGDTCAAAPATASNTASCNNVGRAAAAADAAQGWRTYPAPQQEDNAASLQPSRLHAFDEAVVPTSAREEENPSVSSKPQAEAPKRQLLEHDNAPQNSAESGEAGYNHGTHDADDAAPMDRVLGATAGSSVEVVASAETPLPAVVSAAGQHSASAAPSTDAAPAGTPGIELPLESLGDGARPDAMEAASVSMEEAPAEQHGGDGFRFSGYMLMLTEQDGAAAAYAPSTAGHAEEGDAAPATDVYPTEEKEGATQCCEKPNDTTAADIAFTGAAESAADEAEFDAGKDGDVKLGNEEEKLESPSPTSATITAPSGHTTARYHRYEQDRLRSRPSPPSRLALSYLYYHALEALYVDENITLFVQRARDMAPYGHARLNWLLGVLHAYGVGVPRSERDALMYYSFAAMEAVPEAHMALGYRYKLGLGVLKSCESALAHYREAADAVAMTYDGTNTASSDGVTAMTAGAKTIGSGKGGRSGSTSFFAYRDDAAASDLSQQRRLDIMSLKYQGDIGNVNALLTLGYLLLKGDDQLVRDGRRAAAYFEAAAEKGSARAQGALGQLYMAGDLSISPPLLPDVQRALHHFRLGALQNDALSLNGIGFLHAIGYLYQDKRQGAADTFRNTTGGTGISGETASPTSNEPPDFVTAAQYFYRSHCAEGLYNLGVLFLHGRGVVLDKKHARRLFEKAARQGSVLAQWQLANMLSEAADEGSGIPAAECEHALALYQRTASFGTWQHRAPGNLRSGGGAGVGARYAGMQPQTQRHGPAKKMGAGLDGDTRLLERTGARHVSSHGGSRDEGDDAANHLGGFVRPRSETEYQALLADILDRLHAVEESLVLSDEGEGPTTVSLASFVELLSLAETGDAAAPWLAAQYVDDYLEVVGATLHGGRHAGESGAVPLFWPSTSAPAGASEYLSGEAATSELLYHLLQRTVLHHTHTHATLGAAYLRLGNFYYYGESPLYGVDMERALAYYRIAGDHHHNAQALFNVGFMYQLGLHRAPRATRVVGGMSAQEVSERPGVLRHYTSSPVGAEWKVHSNPPEYLRGSPAFHLTVKAAANAWNRASADPMARGVNVYLAWKYYTASLEKGERGAMAVRFALAVLNVQWSLRHFGAAEMLSKVVVFASPSAAPLASANSASFTTEAGADDVDVPPLAAEGGARGAQKDKHHALQGLLRSLTIMLRFVWDDLIKSTAYAARTMRSWYQPLEDAVLYGAISVVVVGLLIRHHMA